MAKAKPILYGVHYADRFDELFPGLVIHGGTAPDAKRRLGLGIIIR